jgi:hypothetical protein
MMPEVFPYRLVEVLALLPILHVPPGKAVDIGVVGPYSDIMAQEVHRWPEVQRIHLLAKPQHAMTRKYVLSATMPRVDVLLLSPEQDPTPWLRCVKPGGLIQASTTDPGQFQALVAGLSSNAGNAVPWREHLPRPLFGVLSNIGTTKPQRYRQPPKAVQRLTTQYLPCLFTFGKDEIHLAFRQPTSTIAPVTERAHD